ncbi:hypothetical protein AC1031_013526 [Aphanomyces cochlioides]|nr:hypothetical protein AC1031_013526 [Aphanomyces cochlioides]
MARDDAKKRESIVRKKLFRATAGLSLSEQSHVASAMAMNNNNVLETIQKMQSKSKKLSTKQSTQKFEWLRDNSHLRKLEEAAMKELDNALLKILNEAASNTPAKRADSEPATSDSPSFTETVEGFVNTLQSNRLGWIHQVNADRDTRYSMRALVADKSQQDAEWKTHVKPQLESLMIDAIVGHHFVWEKLCADAATTMEQVASTTAALWSSLQNKSAAQDLPALIDSFGECPDPALKLDLLQQFQVLETAMDDDLRRYQMDFERDHGLPSLAEAMSKTGGWSSDDHDRFLKVFKECEPKGIRNDAFITRVVGEMEKTIPEIRQHDQWFRTLRRWSQLKQDRTSEQTRRRESLIESAKAAISSAKEAADKEKLRSEEMTQRLADQELLHAKVARFRGKRSAQADVAAHQAEIARLEAEAVLQAAERKRQKEHELMKKLLQTHKDWQQVEKLAQEQAEAERIAAEAEAQRQLDAINATRVAFRTEVYEQKCELQKQKAIQKAQEEAEKEKILEAIKQEAPYAEKIAQVEADPHRTRQATVAFTANVEAAQEGLGIHETGLFPSHGYDTDKLFKDARFKLGIALRDAGLASTEYAKKAMSTIALRNGGSYRHVAQPATQLW